MDASRLLRSAREGTPEFRAELARLERRGENDFSRVEAQVRSIVAAIREQGDKALLEFVEQFEHRTASLLFERDYGGERAFNELGTTVRDALVLARDRIERYHAHQAQFLGAFEHIEEGVLLGHRVTPLEHVGVYVPGGKARYPSTVLMSALIARVAGVREIIVACPDPCREVRAACHLSGVTGLLNAGGAQAIAALAYGTETVPRVDKIVGPGNVFVAAAKRLVFGEVAIDSIAGPTEILVLADDSGDAHLIAADLLSQAEHDESAYPLFATTVPALIPAVEHELELQLRTLPRQAVARVALVNNGVALNVSSIEGLAALANRIAAEHVALHLRAPHETSTKIARAGAIFVGACTPEAVGDYLAGPSHVLPTGGAARYAAPLGVYDFVSRTSIIAYDASALRAQADPITTLARVEGLEAHARAVEVRTHRSK